MNIKEAIAEIEKRYKAGDRIPCLADRNDIVDYEGIESTEGINIGDGSVWLSFNGERIEVYSESEWPVGERSVGEWSEPIREGKNLWSFFKSIEDTYPDVVEKYLRNLDFSLTTGGRNSNLSLATFAFHWKTTREGKDYWCNINELYESYLEN